MNILINYIEESEPTMLAACIERVKQMANDPADPTAMWDHPEARIQCNRPDKNGFTEYAISFYYKSGGSITIGAIQRTPGAPVEFHS